MLLSANGLAILLFGLRTEAFTVVRPFKSSTRLISLQAATNDASTSANSSSSGDNSNNSSPLDELSEERKASLFQFLLRDLQVEQVPLLAVDADQTDTLQAATWTTVAELCDQPQADKACLVLEDLAVDTLRTFVDDFMLLKTQQEGFASALPELERVSLSLVGKGVGPAILIEVERVKDNDSSGDTVVDEVDTPEPQLSAAVKAFFGRMVERTDPYPYTKEGTPTLFKLCRRSNAFHLLSSFWNSVCELRATDEDGLGTSVLMMPGIESHERFAAVSEWLGRSLCLFQGDDNDFALLHFFPAYDRNKVYPADKPAFGHIPPLRSILSNTKKGDVVQLSDGDIVTSNYQRRSPVAAVAIKRVSLMDLEVDPMLAYAKNAKFLVDEGEAALQQALSNDMSMLD